MCKVAASAYLLLWDFYRLFNGFEVGLQVEIEGGSEGFGREVSACTGQSFRWWGLLGSVDWGVCGDGSGGVSACLRIDFGAHELVEWGNEPP